MIRLVTAIAALVFVVAPAVAQEEADLDQLLGGLSFGEGEIPSLPEPVNPDPAPSVPSESNELLPAPPAQGEPRRLPPATSNVVREIPGEDSYSAQLPLKDPVSPIIAESEELNTAPAIDAQPSVLEPSPVMGEASALGQEAVAVPTPSEHTAVPQVAHLGHAGYAASGCDSQGGFPTCSRPALPPPVSFYDYFRTPERHAGVWDGYAEERQKQCHQHHRHLHRKCDCGTRNQHGAAACGCGSAACDGM